MEFKHVGYYNDNLDIKDLYFASADEVVEYMQKGFGNFTTTTTTSEAHLTTDDLLDELNVTAFITKDKKYIVTFDVCMYYDGVDDYNDNFIDIWERVE